MFTARKTEKHHVKRSHAVNLVAHGTEIIGNIATDGDLRIDGYVQGDIACRAKLVVGPEGRVVGNIHCTMGEISGTVEGRITATDILQLSAGANANGDIESVRLIVEDGASLAGNCRTIPSHDLPRLLEITPHEEAQAISQ